MKIILELDEIKKDKNWGTGKNIIYESRYLKAGKGLGTNF